MKVIKEAHTYSDISMTFIDHIFSNNDMIYNLSRTLGEKDIKQIINSPYLRFRTVIYLCAYWKDKNEIAIKYVFGNFPVTNLLIIPMESLNENIKI